jgi:catalase
MTGKPVDVTVRFSNGTGNPTVPDANPGGRGMAVKFHLPGGGSTDLISMTSPTFPARTADDVLALTAGLSKAIAMMKDDENALVAFQETFRRQRPDLADALDRAVFAQPPASYAEAAYWAVHAFRFENATGQGCFVRYFWQPAAGVASLSKADATRRLKEPLQMDYLQSGLRDRLSARVVKAKGPIEFKLHLQLAADGDDVNDPGTAWPSDRPVVFAGVLQITEAISDQSACEALAFDPARLTDGIATSADPILRVRSGAYFLSHKSRTT